jgi:hypothetical protein
MPLFGATDHSLLSGPPLAMDLSLAAPDAAPRFAMMEDCKQTSE